MRKVIASSMSFVMLATTMAVAPSSMAADIRGRLTACPKLVTFKSNQPEVIEQAGKYIGLKFSAMCGDAIAPMTGMLASFRTYTLPNGTVVEQYEIVKNGKPGVETRLFDAAAIQRARRIQLENTEEVYRVARPTVREQVVIVDKKESHLWRDSVIVLGVIGGVYVSYRLVKASSARRAAEKQAAYEQGARDAAERQAGLVKSTVADMPTSITVAEDIIVDGKVVIKAGTKIATVGAVPSSGAQGIGSTVGRFPSNGQQGQQYVVMQNPNTGLLETLLIMDYINRPFMWGSYYYTSYGYSPFYYGPHGGIMIYDTYPMHTWDSWGYNVEVYNTSNAYIIDTSGEALSIADTSNISAMSDTFTPGSNQANSFDQAGVVDAFNAAPTTTYETNNESGGRSSIFSGESFSDNNKANNNGGVFNAGESFPDNNNVSNGGGLFNSGGSPNSGGSFNGGSFNN